jgi:hypothetical protein
MKESNAYKFGQAIAIILALIVLAVMAAGAVKLIMEMFS